MNLLKITDQDISELDQYFDKTVSKEVEKISPKVEDNFSKIEVEDQPITDFSAVYASIPSKNAVFGRVLLEMIEEKGINVNYSSTAFFTMAKKNYLAHVLNQKKVPTPNKAVIADQKAARNLEKHLKGPLEAKKISELEVVENRKIGEVEEIQEYAEGIDYDKNVLIFSELSKGEKYRCFVAEDTVISLKDPTDTWEVSEENLTYSNISNELEETVKKTARTLGAKICEVILRDGEVIDVNPNPDLQMYKDKSGKNTFETVAEVLENQ